MPELKWILAGKTDRGQIRENNEDSFLVDEKLLLIGVADGLGGHQSGEVASRMAVQLLIDNYRRLREAGALPQPDGGKFSLPTKQLASCIRLANQAIFEAGENYPIDRGMGTTLTALGLHNEYVSLAHVGDSRAYLWRRNHLEQISQDHSLVMDQVRQGLISKEEAAVSKNQHILARALGVEAKVQVDAAEFQVTPEDLFLLCSDGLTKMVPDEQIAVIIETAKNPNTICATLIEAANAAGGRDNITVVVALAQKAGLLAGLKSKFKNHY